MRCINYLKEINAFHDKRETNPLSSSAANLWAVLMDGDSRTGWKVEFTDEASVLCRKVAPSKSAFRRARMELAEKGYIDYESGGVNRGGIEATLSAHYLNGTKRNI